MRFSASLLVSAVPLLVLGAPMRLGKRVAATDILVLKFADVLEQLESTFYSQALKKFQNSDFLSAGFSAAQVPLEQFTVIQSDEATHSSVLQSEIISLGEQPVTSCKFDFSSVLTDVPTMAATARLVENVGVGAYLGGAALISDPQLLSAAATILTVEARHQTVLNILGGASAIPQAFDLPLAPAEVLAIAGPFISGCDLGIQANPTLTVTNSGPITVGTKLSFESSALSGSSSQSMSCQMLVGGAPFSLTLPFSNCVVPSGINGPVAIYITSDDQPLLNNIVQRANSSIVAGPTMAFIDTKTETLGQLVRPSSSQSASESTSTQIISPGAAESIIASASSTASPSSSTGYSPSSSASDSSSSSTPSSSSSPANNAVSAAPGPNLFTGVADNGAVTVNGWTNLPPGINQ